MITQGEFSTCKNELLQLLTRNRDAKPNLQKIEGKYIDRAAVHGNPLILFYHSDKHVIGGLTDFPTIASGCYNPLPVVHHIGDIAVDRAYRKKGIGSDLVRFLIQNSNTHAFFICMPTMAAQKMLMKIGWRKFVRLRLYSLIFGVPIPHALRELACQLNEQTFKFYYALIIKPHRFSGQYRLERKYRFDEEFDMLWQDLTKTGRIYLCRNQKSLSFRYPDLAKSSLEVYLLKMGYGVKGYIVFKKLKAHQIVIHDFVYKNKRDFQALFLLFFSAIKTQSVYRVDVRINENLKDEIGFLKRIGFLPRNDFWDILGYCRANLPHMDMGKKGHWMFTEADKDI